VVVAVAALGAIIGHFQPQTVRVAEEGRVVIGRVLRVQLRFRRFDPHGAQFRGGVLRIHPDNSAKGYTIPAGNFGDYFATHRFVTEVVPPQAWAGELARLRAPLGVHAILGNHDWWYGIKDARDALAQVRIPVMENDAVLLGAPPPKTH